MAGICTDFGAILALDSGPGDQLRQSIPDTGVTGAPNRIQRVDDRESSLKGSRLGLP